MKLQHSNGTRVASDLRQTSSARNKISLNLRKPIFCPQTETCYLSITAASEILGIASSYIYRVLSGELKNAKGYVFEYAKKPPQKDKSNG